MDLLDIIVNIANDKIDELNNNGFVSSGHNGPYYDKETPVRNTAHWAVIFSVLYKILGNHEYYDALEKCGEYLISKEARPMNAAFYCRKNPEKDFSNGTIGQAWAIEGLVAAYDVTKNDKYVKVAEDVFLLHPFDPNYKLWKIVNVDGSYREFDLTFNHQLWFAASGIILLSVTKNKEIEKKCESFLENLSKIFKIYKNGLIKHSIDLKLTKAEKIKSNIRLYSDKLRNIKSKTSMRYKENGYHLFNIYAFALIKSHGYEVSIFNNPNFTKALNYCFNNDLYVWLEKKDRNLDCNNMPNVKSDIINIYGYPYNAPGFELPFIYKVFSKQLDNVDDKFVNNIIKKQLHFTYDQDVNSFNKNTEDPNTLEARLYEYVRLYTV